MARAVDEHVYAVGVTRDDDRTVSEHTVRVPADLIEAWGTGLTEEPPLVRAAMELLVEHHGAEHAVWLAREVAAAVERIGAFAAEHDIDCHYRNAGYLLAATGPAHLGSWDAIVAACRAHGAGDRVEELSAGELRRRTGHEQEDHLLGLRGHSRRHLLCRLREQPLLHQRGQCRAADTEAGMLEEMPPRECLQFVHRLAYSLQPRGCEIRIDVCCRYAW